MTTPKPPLANVVALILFMKCVQENPQAGTFTVTYGGESAQVTLECSNAGRVSVEVRGPLMQQPTLADGIVPAMTEICESERISLIACTYHTRDRDDLHLTFNFQK